MSARTRIISALRTKSQQWLNQQVKLLSFDSDPPYTYYPAVSGQERQDSSGAPGAPLPTAASPATNDRSTTQPGRDDDPSRSPPASGWQRYARLVGFVILVVVSIYGVRQFMAGDAAAVTELWRSNLKLLPLVLLFAMLDLSLETAGWMWILSRLGLKTTDFTGVCVCVAGKAGLLLPAQLGRLIRPDLMVRLGRGKLGENLKAEGAVFVLDAVSVVALFAGLVTWRFNPFLAPVASATVIVVTLFLGNRLASLMSGTRLEFPRTFWWSWQAFAIVIVEASGWVAHGVAFFVLTSGLPGDLGLWDSLFLAPGSAVIGLASGLPGGLGLTEGLLGASLGVSGVPEAHHALGVATFRLITFWLLLPIGWIALALAERQVRKRNELIEKNRAAEGANEPPAVEPTR